MDVFQVIGPVMIGPSSSHTAGAVRIGRLARAILGEQPVRVDVYLHGSFARTYRGHGTDRALVAGLLGLNVDDERVPQALEIATREGLEVSFGEKNLGEVHPNSVRLDLKGEKGVISVTASSLGGAKVIVIKINNFDVEIPGDYWTLIAFYRDRPGVIAAVTALLADRGINIARMRVSREAAGQNALMVLETDEVIPSEILPLLKVLPMMKQVMRVEPV